MASEVWLETNQFNTYGKSIMIYIDTTSQMTTSF